MFINRYIHLNIYIFYMNPLNIKMFYAPYFNTV